MKENIKVLIVALTIVVIMSVIGITTVACCRNVYADSLTSNSVLDFNQQIDNTIVRSSYYGIDFSFDSQGYYVINGNYTASWDAPLGYANNTSTQFTLISGHKYYYSIENTVNNVINILNINSSNIVFSSGNSFNGIYTSNGNYSGYFGLYAKKGYGTYNFKSRVMLIDLSQCFGIGNEPSTVEEFRSYFGNDYYQYTLSSLVSLNTVDAYNSGYSSAMSSYTVSKDALDFYNSVYASAGTITKQTVQTNNIVYFTDTIVYPLGYSLTAGDLLTLSMYGFGTIGASGTISIGYFDLNSNYKIFNSYDTSTFHYVSSVRSYAEDLELNITVPESLSNIVIKVNVSSGYNGVINNCTVVAKTYNGAVAIQQSYEEGRKSVDIANVQKIAYENGYRAGLVDDNPYTFRGLISAVLDVPVETITGLLDFDILGVNMKGLYLSLFTLALIIAIIKLVTGK